MNWFKDFRHSLKISAGEEFFDLVLNRPLGFVLVKLIAPFPVTPNQVSWFSVAVSLGAALILADNNIQLLPVSGALILLGNVLDCVDGQLARLRGIQSQYGRIVDGAADYLSGILLCSGLALWNPAVPWLNSGWPWIAVASLLVLGWQSSLVDYFRNEFTARLKGDTDFTSTDLRRAEIELESVRTETGSWFKRLIMRLYRTYAEYQLGTQRRGLNVASLTPQEYLRRNETIVRLWCLNGSATPRFLFVVSCFMNRLEWLPIYILVPSTLWTIVLLIIQRAIDHKKPGMSE